MREYRVIFRPFLPLQPADQGSKSYATCAETFKHYNSKTAITLGRPIGSPQENNTLDHMMND